MIDHRVKEITVRATAKGEVLGIRERGCPDFAAELQGKGGEERESV